jgi:hypothetical protein
MTQFDDLDLIAVRIQHERRDLYSQFQCWAGLNNSPTNGFKAIDSIKRAELNYQQYFQLSVFSVLLALLFLEQMTKEVPGIRPAVISTEAGTRLDESCRFRRVVRNMYTHSFDPAKLGKLVNSAPELVA